MNLTLVYAYWPSRPSGVTWRDLPYALSDAGIAGCLRDGGHEIEEIFLVAQGNDAAETKGGFALAGSVGHAVRSSRFTGKLPIVLCGSCAVAAIAGLDARRRSVVWFDAHPDLNTPETMQSELLDRMALVIATGFAQQAMAIGQANLRAVSIDEVCLFGARDIDNGEAGLIERYNVPVLTNPRETYIHLDMDVHDALAVRTNVFAVPDGPCIGEVRDALCTISNVRVLSLTGLEPVAADGIAALQIAMDHVLSFANAQDPLL